MPPGASRVRQCFLKGNRVTNFAAPHACSRGERKRIPRTRCGFPDAPLRALQLFFKKRALRGLQLCRGRRTLWAHWTFVHMLQTHDDSHRRPLISPSSCATSTYGGFPVTSLEFVPAPLVERDGDAAALLLALPNQR